MYRYYFSSGYLNPLLPNGKHLFPQCQNFDFNLRRDHQKNFLWASRLWVGRRKEPTLRYVPKNYARKNSGSYGLKKWKFINLFNPLLPNIGNISSRSAKILIKGSSKKFPMSVATMSRQTKWAYLRLCPEKLWKTELVAEGVNILVSYKEFRQ